MPTQLDTPLTDGSRGPRLFSGEVLVFRQVPAARSLVALAQRRLRACFPEVEEVATAQHALSEETFLRRVVGLTADWRKDAEVAEAFTDLLTGLGCDPDETYVDDFYLRTQPSRLGRRHRRTRPLHAHRDTWGSNLMAQVNWWLPVTPLTAERTLALFPRYWRQPIANDSADWDWEELKTARRRARADGQDPDAAYPTLPQPLEPVDQEDAVRLLPEVGDVVAFSAAHLHASVPNASGLTRFSLETRTLWSGDLDAGRGAPNLDGRAPRVPREWFRRLSDGTSLAEAWGYPA